MLKTLERSWTGFDPILPESPILIVVENDIQRASLGIRLSLAGMAYELAENGEHAIDLFRQNPRDYAAVLLDTHMSGLDGPKTLAVLRQIGLDSPVIFIEGESHDYPEESLLAIGATGVLHCPISPVELFESIRSATAA